MHGMLAGRSGTTEYVTTERVNNVCCYITAVINNLDFETRVTFIPAFRS